MFKKSYALILLSIVLLSSSVNASSGNTGIIEKTNDELLLELGYSQQEVLSFKLDSMKSFNVNDNSDDLGRLAQLGYSKAEVEDLGENDMIYLEGLSGELVGLDIKYMKKDLDLGMIEVSKSEFETGVEEYNLQMQICNTSSSTCEDQETSPGWMTLKTAVSRISNTSPQEYLIKHDYTWTKKPFYTFKDAVGVAHHVSMSPIQNSEYLKYSSDVYSSRSPISGVGPWTSEGSTDRYLYSANDKTGGMAFEFYMFSDSNQLINGVKYKYENHRGTVAYRAVRNNSNYTIADISGHYIHTEQSYSGSLGVDVTGTGSFSISANITKTPALQTGVTFSY